MASALTKKEKGFVKDYVKTGNGTKSALNNYDTKDENIAASIASQNLRKLKIQNAVKSIAESIPDELLVQKHLELLNSTIGRSDKIDVQGVKAGLDMAYKIKSTYAAEKNTHIIITDEEARAKTNDALNNFLNDA